MPHDSTRLQSRPISRSYNPTRKKSNPKNTRRAVVLGRHLACTIPWLIQKSQGPITPSTALSTKGSFVSFPTVGLSNPTHCQVAHKAVCTIKSEYTSAWPFIPELFRLWTTPMSTDICHRSHKHTRQKTKAQHALQAFFLWPDSHLPPKIRQPTSTVPQLIQKSHGPVLPSTALSMKGSFVSLPPGGPSIPVLRQVARKVVRTAVSVLCKEMLQPGQCAALGSYEVEEAEVRLQALARLEPFWGKSKYGVSGTSTQLGPLGIVRDRVSSASALEEELERNLFAGALRDGYILCRWVSSLTSFRPIHVFLGRDANGIFFFFFFLAHR